MLQGARTWETGDVEGPEGAPIRPSSAPRGNDQPRAKLQPDSRLAAERRIEPRGPRPQANDAFAPAPHVKAARSPAPAETAPKVAPSGYRRAPARRKPRQAWNGARALNIASMAFLMVFGILVGLALAGFLERHFTVFQSAEELAERDTRAEADRLALIRAEQQIAEQQAAAQQAAQRFSALDAENNSLQVEIDRLRAKNEELAQALAELDERLVTFKIFETYAAAQRTDNHIAALELALQDAVRSRSNGGFDDARQDTTPLVGEPVLVQPQPEADVSGDQTSAVQDEPEVATARVGAIANPPVDAKLSPVDIPLALAPADQQTRSISEVTLLPLAKPERENIAGFDQAPVQVASLVPGLPTDPEPVPEATGPVSGQSARFIANMQALRAGSLQRPITILHLGDSHISADSFTRGIRRRLQETYGNAGRGAVIPADAYKWAHVDGLTLASKGGWSAASSLKVKSGPYGVSGVRVATANTGAKMVLTSKTGNFDWAEVTLFTGPGQGKVTVATDAGSKTVSARSSREGSKVVRVDGSSKTLTLTHAGGGKTTVLNWATGKNSPGIRYVNFGIAGATASVTKRWSDGLLAADIERINPDLVVYGYGTNEGYNDNLNVNSYKQLATGLVDKIRASAPNAALMFVGPADGARKRGGQSCGGGWYTPTKLGEVRTALQGLAKQYSAFYWDWAGAMGGRCGVTKWSTSSPKLAAGDRVHLTAKGYDKSAAAFVDYLQDRIAKGVKVAAE